MRLPYALLVTLRRLHNGQLFNTPRKMPLAFRQPVFSSACFAVVLLRTPPRFFLLSDAELGDNGAVALDVLGHQIVQHLAALTDHLQQAAAAVVVVDVDLQVLGELLNPGGEDGDLDLGGAGVRGMGAVGLDDGRLFVLTDHVGFPPFISFARGLRDRPVRAWGRSRG